MQESSRLAYNQASNAVAIFAKNVDKAPTKANVFAHELTVENQWSELAEVLGWVREEMNVKRQ